MELNCLSHTLTKEQALAQLKSGMREARYGKLRYETGFFVPYYLFKVEVKNAEQHRSRWLAIDAVEGRLDLHTFEQELTAEDFDTVESDQFAPTNLQEKEAFALLREKVQRDVYLKGFFRLRDLQIEGHFLRQYYQPYWVGIYERKNQATLEIIDAVRGQFEGAKLRELLTDWIHAR